MLRQLLISTLLLPLLACESTPDRDQLDIASSPNDQPADASQAAGPSTLAVSTNPEKMPAQELFNWQRLYKDAPSAKERNLVRERLEASRAAEGQTAGSGLSFEQKLQNARNMLAIGRREESKDLYLELLKADPAQIDVQLELAHLHLSEGNSERAFDYISSVRKQLDALEKPSTELTFRYRYALASAYILSQNRKKGHQILTDLISKNPDFIPAYAALAQSYLHGRHPEIAEFIAKRGLDRGPDDPRLLNLVAVSYLQRNRGEEARIWIEKALTVNPDFVPALINRSHLAMGQREFARAENDLQKAVNLDPLSVDGQMALGLLLKKTGRLTSARGCLEKAVQIDPQNPFARYHLGLLLAKDFKDETAALQLFYDVLQARDDDAEIKNLAKVQIQSIRDSRLYSK